MIAPCGDRSQNTSSTELNFNTTANRLIYTNLILGYKTYFHSYFVKGPEVDATGQNGLKQLTL